MLALSPRWAAGPTDSVQHCACYAAGQRRHEVHCCTWLHFPACESCCCKYPGSPDMRSMLTDHRDNSQCPGLRFRSRRNALWGLHRDYSPSCGRSDAALSQALAVCTVDSETTFQVIRNQCLSHVSTLYSLDMNARNCSKRLRSHDLFPPGG